MQTPLARNRLVWIGAAAWRDLGERLADAESRAVVAYWRDCGLPLVVRSRTPAAGPGCFCAGLPAPARWSRRRVHLEAPVHAITRTGSFPQWAEATAHYGWGRIAGELSQRFESAGARAFVYGSHGWQMLTGELYVHETSDIDLSIEVPDVGAACRVMAHLQAVCLPRRLDGEIVFPNGDAVAWRELARMLSNETDEVLVKSLDGPRLAAAGDVMRLAA